LAAAGPYVAGPAFTIGDIPIGLVVHRWFSMTFERPDYPHVAGYYGLLSERPAYMRYVRNGMP
jgi:glutathione S-transferase